MRCRIAILTGAALLLVSMLGVAQTASAQPEHFTVADCVPSEGGQEYCYEETYMVNVKDMPSGRTVIVSSLKATYTFSLDGIEIESGEYKSRTIRMDLNGISQVEHMNGRRVVTYTDPTSGEQETCTYTYVFVYAGDEIRHDDERLVCG
jgi:hypothetical protein